MDSHFNGYKCKYDLMNEWMKPRLNSTYVKSIRIFINLDDFFHYLFKPSIDREFEICGKDVGKQFLSNVFNLLAHYRYWAIKHKYQVEVYGFFSSATTYKNAIFLREYREKPKGYFYGDKYFYVRDAIRSSIDLIKSIASYIPKVYIIDTEYLEPSILPAYISEKKNSVDLNILISRDIYDLQYAYRDKWMYISPKGEQSSFIHRGNLWDYINYKEHIYSDDKELNYPSKLLILARAIVGDKYRNIPRLRSIGWKTFFKFVNEVQSRLDGDSYILLEMQLRELLKGKLIHDSALQNNINCIDIDVQLSMMSEIDRSVIDRQIVDIEDFENLKMINSRKLAKYPLNLKFLCDTLQSPISSRSNQW